MTQMRCAIDTIIIACPKTHGLSMWLNAFLVNRNWSKGDTESLSSFMALPTLPARHNDGCSIPNLIKRIFISLILKVS